MNKPAISIPYLNSASKTLDIETIKTKALRDKSLGEPLCIYHEEPAYQGRNGQWGCLVCCAVVQGYNVSVSAADLDAACLDLADEVLGW